MHLVQILLPRADNSGRPFREQEFDKVKEELAREFDGVTAYLRAPAEGLWKQGQNASHDDIVIFEVMADEMSLDRWRERRRALELRFRQDRVVIRYMSMALV
jgi:hypothetical protein